MNVSIKIKTILIEFYDVHRLISVYRYFIILDNQIIYIILFILLII